MVQNCTLQVEYTAALSHPPKYILHPTAFLFGFVKIFKYSVFI